MMELRRPDYDYIVKQATRASKVLADLERTCGQMTMAPETPEGAQLWARSCRLEAEVRAIERDIREVLAKSQPE